MGIGWGELDVWQPPDTTGHHRTPPDIHTVLQHLLLFVTYYHCATRWMLYGFGMQCCMINGDYIMNYQTYIANRDAEAEAWIEENAFAMVEDRPEQSLAFGVEYFDTDSLHEDFDGMDYFERMGLRAVTESKRTVYVDTGILEDRHTHPRYTDRTATSGHYYPLDGVLSDPARPVACAVIPYKGQPISKYSADCERATGRAQHIREQKALAEMANKDSQKVRRYAKKHQVSISAAIGALRGAGKLA